MNEENKESEETESSSKPKMTSWFHISMIIIMVIILSFMVKMSFSVFSTITEDLSEKPKQNWETNIITTYNKENKYTFEIEDKSFGESGAFREPAYYLILKLGNDSQIVKVEKELYHKYKKGGSLILWDDSESRYMLTEKNEIIRRFD